MVLRTTLLDPLYRRVAAKRIPRLRQLIRLEIVGYCLSFVERKRDAGATDVDDSVSNAELKTLQVVDRRAIDAVGDESHIRAHRRDTAVINTGTDDVITRDRLLNVWPSDDRPSTRIGFEPDPRDCFA